MPYIRAHHDTDTALAARGSCGCAAGPRIGGFLAEPPAAAPRRTGPVFRFECPAGCDPVAANQCRSVLRQAIVSAIFLCTNAANKLEASPRDPATVRIFRSFFGHDPSRPVTWANNKESGLSVAHRFRKVAEALRARGTMYRCDACAGSPTTNAFVTPATERNVIFLCPRFWSLAHLAPLTDRQRRFFRAGIVLHEMLHLLYSSFFRHLTVPPRPDDPQERRRDNSHCYEAFALRLAGHRVDPADLTSCRGRPA